MFEWPSGPSIGSQEGVYVHTYIHANKTKKKKKKKQGGWRVKRKTTILEYYPIFFDRCDYYLFFSFSFFAFSNPQKNKKYTPRVGVKELFPLEIEKHLVRSCFLYFYFYYCVYALRKRKVGRVQKVFFGPFMK